MQPGEATPVDLIEDGLLYLINVALFHPLGYALAMVMPHEDALMPELQLGRAPDGWMAFPPELARIKTQALLEVFDGDDAAQLSLRENCIRYLSANAQRLAAGTVANAQADQAHPNVLGAG